jgi:predicted acetyltransferase
MTASDPAEYDVRSFGPAELAGFLAHHDKIYGRAADPRLADIWQQDFDYARSLLVSRAGRLVATAGGCATRLRTPGGSLPAVSLSYLAVDPSERRRGLSADLLRRQYEEASERGEPIAVFVTSHGYQYARIGAGVIAWSSSACLHNERAQLLSPGRGEQNVTVLTESWSDSLSDPLYEVYTRATSGRAGTLEFGAGWWRAYRSERALGSPSQLTLIASRSGRPSGYAICTVDESWPDGVPSNVVTVRELIAEDEPTRRALWELILTMDLASRTHVDNIPVDDTLRWLLREPRELRMRGIRDILWARILDLPAVLEGRRYRGSGSVVLEVEDRFLPRNAGRWRIDVADGEGRVTAVDSDADAALGIGDLATLFTGAGSYRALRDAGRIAVYRPEAERLATLFAVDEAPWCAFVV